MDTQIINASRHCRLCGRLWCRGGCRRYRQWPGVAVGLGCFVAVGLVGLFADGCLSPDRAETLQKSLTSAAVEVKAGSKEVINEFADRLEGVVEKIPTKFELAPTEVSVTIESFPAGGGWLAGVFAFFVGIPCGVLGLILWQAVRAAR